MPATVSVASFGIESADALRSAIARAQQADPLSPVTVVTPSNYAGLSLRRQLVRDSALVNVSFLVFGRLAELLGAPLLSKRGLRPLKPEIRAEAVRAALSAHLAIHSDSNFATVSGHLATSQSLEATFSDLREANAETLERLTRSSKRADEVISILGRYRELVADRYYDETDLADAAAEAVRNGSPALRDVGQVVVYLPRELTGAESGLVRALGDAGLATVILGVTGDASGDANLAAMRARLAAPRSQQMGFSAGASFAPTHIVHVPDADEEVRTAIRMVMAGAAAGTALPRMAILYPNATVYGPLVHERLSAAGIPHNGPGVTTLGQTIAGRLLVGMLRLRETNFRRDAVMNWLTAGPVVDPSTRRFPPTNTWDTITREAGVVAGVAQWTLQLERYVRKLNGELSDPDSPVSEAKAAFVERQVGHVGGLKAFIVALAADLAPPSASTWKAHGEWAHELLKRYMGDRANFSGCPDADHEEAERKAYEDVVDQIEKLEALDSVGAGLKAGVDADAFLQALERLLEAKSGRVGPFGSGIFSSGIANAAGMDFDVVFILGMVEGQMPSLGRDDPLLPDHERSAVDATLPLRLARRADERRSYLTALASASAKDSERILVTSAADLRGQQKHLPSRWLLDAAGQLSGARSALGTNDFLALNGQPWLTRIASFQAALQNAPEPGMSQEYDLRLMLSGSAGRDAMGRITPGIEAGMTATRARAGRNLGRFDGVIGVRPELRPSDARPTSPTALQTWATCPFSYFLKSVLRVRERENPEDILVLNAAEFGKIVHATLDQFMKANDGHNGPWEPQHLAQILAIGAAQCDAAEAEGITGKPLLWDVERQRIRRDLEGFLEADAARCAETGFLFRAGEYPFGLRGATNSAVRVELADGTAIAFRGQIDRVDRDPLTGKLAVYDYKTGRRTGYDKLDKDHLNAGQLLQLPIYAVAAAEAFKSNDPVWASYWFVTRKGEYEHRGYLVEDKDLDEFRRALNVIANGIEGGVFPANPGPPETRWGGTENCGYCPFDRICPRDRLRAWGRRQESPEIVEYLELAKAADSDDDN